MNRFRTPLFAAATIAMAVSFAGGATTWASAAVAPHARTLTGTGFGTGTTAAIAHTNALDDLRGNYRGCTDITLVFDKMLNGGW